MKNIFTIAFLFSFLTVFSQQKADTGVFELVTDASTLKDGDEIILVAHDQSGGNNVYRAFGVFYNSNFDAALLSDVNFTSDRISFYPVSSSSALRLEDCGNGKWYLHTSDDKCLHSVKDASIGETKSSPGLYSYVLGTTKSAKSYASCSISIDNNVGHILFDKGSKVSSSQPRASIMFKNQGGNGEGSFSCYTANTNKDIYPYQIYRRKSDIILLNDNESISENVTPLLGESVSFRIDRSFIGGKLHTLCLPFDFKYSEVKRIFGESTVAYQYASVENNSSMVFRQTTGDIPAGTPFLLVPAKSVSNPPCFQVSVPNDLDIDNLHQIKYDENYSFNGTLVPYNMKTDGTELFINSDEGFSQPTTSGNRIRGLRAFFRIPYSTDSSCLALFLISNSNGINEITLPLHKSSMSKGYFSIDGIYVGDGLSNTHNGLYIHEGKKVIVTNKR